MFTERVQQQNLTALHWKEATEPHTVEQLVSRWPQKLFTYTVQKLPPILLKKINLSKPPWHDVMDHKTRRVKQRSDWLAQNASSSQRAY